MLILCAQYKFPKKNTKFKTRRNKLYSKILEIEINHQPSILVCSLLNTK